MKYYYFYTPSVISPVGAMFLFYFVAMCIFVLLIIINFRFRVNRTRQENKNANRPLIYLIPAYIEHAEEFIDEIEYRALKGMIFNPAQGHYMRLGFRNFRSERLGDQPGSKLQRPKGTSFASKNDFKGISDKIASISANGNQNAQKNDGSRGISGRGNNGSRINKSSLSSNNNIRGGRNYKILRKTENSKEQFEPKSNYF